MRALLLAVLSASCSVPPTAPPVRVVREGQPGLVLACSVVDVGLELSEARCATADREWRALCERVDGLQGAAPASVDFFSERLVVVPVPTGVDMQQVEVSSEEGVDVVTLDVAPAEDAPVRPRVALLRLQRRSCQLAVVLRDDVRGAERTLAVYPPTR